MLSEIRGEHWEQRHREQLTDLEIFQREALLKKLNFVLLPEGVVQLGTPNPVPCTFEGHRLNEVNIRVLTMNSFWICKYTVSNTEFEQFNAKRQRPPTSQGDKQPVTNVTYLNALKYAQWLSKQLNLCFSIPTEPEWVYAAAPFGWEYSYQEEKSPKTDKTHNFILGQSSYQTLEINDLRYGVNTWGLYHMGGNVQEYTLGSYYIPGNWGALTDGRYCIVKGGDFGNCPLSSGIQRRGIVDVSARSERIGIRLMHPDLRNDP